MHKIAGNIVFLAISVLSLCGCAQQENHLSPNGERPAWDKSDAATRNNAQEAKDPTIKAETYFTTALLLEKQNDLAGAIRNYHKALETKPDYITATDRLGEIYMRLKQYDSAESVYRNALKYHPKSTAVLNNLAFTHIAQNRYSDAEAELNRIFQIDPKSDYAWGNLGLLKAKQGKYDESLKAFRHVCPEDEANYNLAMILHAEGKVEPAKKYYQIALKLNPTFEAARKGLQQVTSQPASASAPVNDIPAKQ